MIATIEQYPTPDVPAQFAVQSGQSAIDGVNPDRLIDSDATDLSFFIDTGLGRLLRAMLKQSLIDIIADRKDDRAPAEVSMSSRWPMTDAGRASINFLMPSVHADQVIARIYRAPDEILQSLMRAETGQDEPEKNEAENQALPTQTLAVNGEDTLKPVFDGSPGALSSDDAEDHPVQTAVAHDEDSLKFDFDGLPSGLSGDDAEDRHVRPQSHSE